MITAHQVQLQNRTGQLGLTELMDGTHWGSYILSRAH